EPADAARTTQFRVCLRRTLLGANRPDGTFPAELLRLLRCGVELSQSQKPPVRATRRFLTRSLARDVPSILEPQSAPHRLGLRRRLPRFLPRDAPPRTIRSSRPRSNSFCPQLPLRRRGAPTA